MSYQYRKSHCGEKTIVRSSYLHNGISYTGKVSSLYWFRPLVRTKYVILLVWTLPYVLTSPMASCILHHVITYIYERGQMSKHGEAWDYVTKGVCALNTLRPRHMAAIFQTTFSNTFSWKKMSEFRLQFHWSLFLRVQLTICQHCFR